MNTTYEMRWKKQIVKLNGCSRMYVFLSHPSTLYYIWEWCMCMWIIQTLHLDKSSSPSDKVMMYTYVGAGSIVFLVIISIVAGIIYKRFRNRGKCYLIKYNIKDATVIIATIVKDTTLMIHMDIIVNIILFDKMFIRNT